MNAWVDLLAVGEYSLGIKHCTRDLRSSIVAKSVLLYSHLTAHHSLTIYASIFSYSSTHHELPVAFVTSRAEITFSCEVKCSLR